MWSPQRKGGSTFIHIKLELFDGRRRPSSHWSEAPDRFVGMWGPTSRPCVNEVRGGFCRAGNYNQQLRKFCQVRRFPVE
jgi:hypothetical protein